MKKEETNLAKTSQNFGALDFYLTKKFNDFFMYIYDSERVMQFYQLEFEVKLIEHSMSFINNDYLKVFTYIFIDMYYFI